MKRMRLSAKSVKLIEKFVELLDNKFDLKSFKFGIDPFFSFLPGVGPFIPSIFTLFLITLALRAQVPSSVLMRMIGYLGIDLIISLVPVLGLPLDAIFHANANSWRLVKPFVTDHKHKDDIAAKFDTNNIIIEGEIVE